MKNSIHPKLQGSEICKPNNTNLPQLASNFSSLADSLDGNSKGSTASLPSLFAPATANDDSNVVEMVDETDSLIKNSSQIKQKVIGSVNGSSEIDSRPASFESNSESSLVNQNNEGDGKNIFLASSNDAGSTSLRLNSNTEERKSIILQFACDMSHNTLLDEGAFNTSFYPIINDAIQNQLIRTTSSFSQNATGTSQGNNHDKEKYHFSQVNINATLLRGAYSGRMDVVEACLSCGASLSYRDGCGRTVLHFAVSGGHLDVTTYIVARAKEEVERGFVNARDVRNWTPLHISVCKDFVLVAKYLIEEGADIHMFLQHNSAPATESLANSRCIHFAALRGNVEMTQMLIDKGAKADDADDDCRLPLHYAAARGHIECARYLLDIAPSTSKSLDRSNRSPLHVSALFGRLGVTELLINAGSELNTKDAWDLDPYHLAVTAGHLKTAELIRSAMEKAGLDTCHYAPPIDSRTPFFSKHLKSPVEHELNHLEKALLNTLESGLQESNRVQLCRTLRRLGTVLCLTIFQETLEVQNKGGLLTADGQRKRTAGGVFFHLIHKRAGSGEISNDDWSYIVKETRVKEKSDKQRKKWQSNDFEQNCRAENRLNSKEQFFFEGKNFEKPQNQVEKRETSQTTQVRKPSERSGRESLINEENSGSDSRSYSIRMTTLRKNEQAFVGKRAASSFRPSRQTVATPKGPGWSSPTAQTRKLRSTSVRAGEGSKSLEDQKALQEARSTFSSARGISTSRLATKGVPSTSNGDSRNFTSTRLAGRGQLLAGQMAGQAYLAGKNSSFVGGEALPTKSFMSPTKKKGIAENVSYLTNLTDTHTINEKLACKNEFQRKREYGSNNKENHGNKLLRHVSQKITQKQDIAKLSGAKEAGVSPLKASPTGLRKSNFAAPTAVTAQKMLAGHPSVLHKTPPRRNTEQIRATSNMPNEQPQTDSPSKGTIQHPTKTKEKGWTQTEAPEKKQAQPPPKALENEQTQALTEEIKKEAQSPTEAPKEQTPKEEQPKHPTETPKTKKCVLEEQHCETEKGGWTDDEENDSQAGVERFYEQ